MSKNRSIFAKLGLASTILFAIATIVISKTHSDPAFSNIHIKNGKMDDRFYRGGQPDKSDFKDLKAIGINTIIDLQDNPTNYEKPLVEGLGMRYLNIPMSDSSYPKQGSIDSFLKLVSDPSSGKFFVHCAGGRHRTGVMGAVYRFNINHWTYDQAYAEMKEYDFYTRFGHGDLRKYVEDYFQKMQANVAAAASAMDGKDKD